MCKDTINYLGRPRTSKSASGPSYHASYAHSKNEYLIKLILEAEVHSFYNEYDTYVIKSYNKKKTWGLGPSNAISNN